jgi:hypothetical protein
MLKARPDQTEGWEGERGVQGPLAAAAAGSGSSTLLNLLCLTSCSLTDTMSLWTC